MLVSTTEPYILTGIGQNEVASHGFSKYSRNSTDYPCLVDIVVRWLGCSLNRLGQRLHLMFFSCLRLQHEICVLKIDTFFPLDLVHETHRVFLYFNLHGKPQPRSYVGRKACVLDAVVWISAVSSCNTTQFIFGFCARANN